MLTDVQKSHLEKIAKDIVAAKSVEILKSINHSDLPFPNVLGSKTPFDKEFSIVRLAKACACKDRELAPLELEMIGSDIEFAKSVDGLGNRSGATGGYTIPTQVSDRIIGYLEAKECVRASGATVMPMSFDKMDITVDEGGVEAVYVNQNEEGDESQPTWGKRSMVVNDMMALVPISNSMLQDVGAPIENFVRNRIERAIRLTEDRVYARGTGIGEPQGIINTPDVPYVAATTLAALDLGFVSSLFTLIEAADAEVDGIVMHPTIKNTLHGLQDGIGRYLWWDNPSNATESRFKGVPVRYSSKLKYTVSGTTYYPIILGEWKHAIIGQRSGIQIAASVDTEFKKNQTIIRAIFRHDFKVGQKAALAYGMVTSA